MRQLLEAGLLDRIGQTAGTRLFDHAGMRFPEGVLQALLEEYSFERQSGRQPGEEEQGSKLRKGVAGDWQNYFDEHLARKFAEAAGGNMGA